MTRRGILNSANPNQTPIAGADTSADHTANTVNTANPAKTAPTAQTPTAQKADKDSENTPVTRENYARQVAERTASLEAKAAQSQHAKGKLSARERINLLLDEGSFQELATWQGSNWQTQAAPAAVICGFGQIRGRQVAVYAQDFSIRGGSLGVVEGEKITSLIHQATRLRIPLFALLDSGGARIQEGVEALTQYGHIFHATCTASGVIPQISIILGPCAGGAVYGPALTDFVIMTGKTSYMFVTGPQVVKAATGEEISAQNLGGAQLHNQVSGVAHFMAENEAEALSYGRNLLTYLPQNCQTPTGIYDFSDPQTETAARQVGRLVPANPKQPYDMLPVIEHLVDYGEFLEVQADFAPSVIVGFACFNGRPTGIVANQPAVDAGTLHVDASEKAARFVQCCDAFRLPLLTLVDVPGYRPGSNQERAGIIRRGAKMITAYSQATIPLLTIILRKAYGGAYIVMGSKSLGADLNYAWPGSEIAVMGAEGAVDIINRREIKADPELRPQLIADYVRESLNPNRALATGALDGLVAPEETRDLICQSLAALATKNLPAGPSRTHANAPL